MLLERPRAGPRRARRSPSTRATTSRCCASTGSTRRRCRSPPTPRAGTSAAVLGFPRNGPYDVRAGPARARRARSSPRTPTAAGRCGGSITSLRGAVRSGNSGGPDGRRPRPRRRRRSSRRPRRGPRGGYGVPNAVVRRALDGRAAAPGLARAPCAAAEADRYPRPTMAKTLVIAEKPSVGRDLDPGAPGPVRQARGLPRVRRPRRSRGRSATSCSSPSPTSTTPKFKKWRMADLPIVPDDFKLVVRDERSRKQMTVITRAAAARRRRRGRQRLRRRPRGRADLRLDVYEKAGVEEAGPAPVAVLDDRGRDQAGLRATCARPTEFAKLEEAARSRSEADWIVGMNATRAATIRLRSSFDGAVSLGRVQTPTLAIIARREEEIRAFEPEPYWLVDATFEPQGGEPGRALRGPLPRRRQAAPGDRRGGRGDRRRRARPGRRDHQARDDRALREARRCSTTSRRSSARPTPASASPRAARSRAAQRLYEEHKALTYPRTNSRFLTTDMVGEIKPIAELRRQRTASTPRPPRT